MRVLYTRLYNLGNYENERFEVEEEVPADESADQTAQRLRDLVEQMKAQADEERRQARQVAPSKNGPNF